MTVLSVSDLRKSFYVGGPLEVLKGVSLELHAGQSLAIVGPSGCGKSTLLQILGTLDRPDQGKVSLAGVDPFAMDETSLARFRNEQIGFIFQDHHLLPQLTVIENVMVPALAFGSAGDKELSRAKELLERVELSDRLYHLPGELSGGQRERVAIARALFRNPVLLLADEPTGNLDRRTSEIITRLLLELHHESQSILIVVTHSEKLAGAMQRQAELVDGLLVTGSGSPA